MTQDEAKMLLKNEFKNPTTPIDFEGTLQSYITYVKPQSDNPEIFIPYIKIGNKEFTLAEYKKLISDAQ